MLWAIFIFLLVLWLAGVVANYTLGGLIHVLLGLAVLVLLAQVITREHEQGAQPLQTRSKDVKPEKPEDKSAA